MKPYLRRFSILLVGLALCATACHVEAASATVVINRINGTPAARATGVRLVYTDVQPAVNAQGIPTATALPGQVVAATFPGNNPTSLTATNVPLSRLWFTMQAFNADGASRFLRPLVIDLSTRGLPDDLNGVLQEGTITVVATVDEATGKVTFVAKLELPDGTQTREMSGQFSLLEKETTPAKPGWRWPWSKKDAT